MAGSIRAGRRRGRRPGSRRRPPARRCRRGVPASRGRRRRHRPAPSPLATSTGYGGMRSRPPLRTCTVGRRRARASGRRRPRRGRGSAPARSRRRPRRSPRPTPAPRSAIRAGTPTAAASSAGSSHSIARRRGRAQWSRPVRARLDDGHRRPAATARGRGAGAADVGERRRRDRGQIDPARRELPVGQVGVRWKVIGKQSGGRASQKARAVRSAGWTEGPAAVDALGLEDPVHEAAVAVVAHGRDDHHPHAQAGKAGGDVGRDPPTYLWKPSTSSSGVSSTSGRGRRPPAPSRPPRARRARRLGRGRLAQAGFELEKTPLDKAKFEAEDTLG